MAGTWKDFTGINLLSTKYEKLVGTVLLKNELGGVTNGYELSHAGAGNPQDKKSGYSFGGNQMDLASEPTYILVKTN